MFVPQGLDRSTHHRPTKFVPWILNIEIEKDLSCGSVLADFVIWRERLQKWFCENELYFQVKFNVNIDPS